MPTVVCKHCGKKMPHRARGLCRLCFKTHRDQYPPLKRQGYKKNKAYEDFDGGFELADEPCLATPGSEEKIRVLAARFEAKVCLWHPMDLVDDSHPLFLIPAPADKLLDSGNHDLDEEETDGN